MVTIAIATTLFIFTSQKQINSFYKRICERMLNNNLVKSFHSPNPFVVLISIYCNPGVNHSGSKYLNAGHTNLPKMYNLFPIWYDLPFAPPLLLIHQLLL